MRVWIVTYEPYHDNSEILAVFSSRDKALGAYPWADESKSYEITEKRVDHHEPIDPPVVEPKRKAVDCPYCVGTGRIGRWRQCSYCAGTGAIAVIEVTT